MSHEEVHQQHATPDAQLQKELKLIFAREDNELMCYDVANDIVDTGLVKIVDKYYTNLSISYAVNSLGMDMLSVISVRTSCKIKYITQTNIIMNTVFSVCFPIARRWRPVFRKRYVMASGRRPTNHSYRFMGT